jgi:hypothetical protein
MHRERPCPSLLAELRDREEDAYRLSVREAKRVRTGPSAIVLRLIAAHTNHTLDELAAMARKRRIRLGSFSALAKHALCRVRDAALDWALEEEDAYRRALARLDDGVEIVSLLEEAALEERDDALVRWSRRWLEARQRFIAEVTSDVAAVVQEPPLSHPAPASGWRRK